MIDPYTEKSLKVLENRLSVVENIVESIRNTSEYEIKIIEEKLKKIDEDLKSIKQQLEDIKIKIRAIQDQMPLFATIEKVKSLEKYIDIIDPFSYLTKKEAERLIDKKIKEILGSKGDKIKVYKEDQTY